jgi:mRNA interferase HigB
MFPHADAVEGFTIFNIKGNRYRLITKIDYENRIVYVRELSTHADYSKGRWRR